MLLPKDMNPANSIYFSGALVIESLNKIEYNKVDFLDLYKAVSDSNKVSMQAFILALDWLFILGSIKLDSKGRIVKCF